MKKIGYILLFAIITSLVSCNETSEFDKQLDSYFILNTQFFYPNEANSNYYVLLDGDTIRKNSSYVSRTSKSVTLEVFEKGEAEAEFSQEITLTADKTIQFIKLPGQPIAIYEADKYTQVKFNIVYAQEEDPTLYTLFFNGITFDNDRNFYLSTAQLSGTLEIKKEGEKVYSKEVSVEPGVTQNYLQISETEYASLPIEDLPAPDKSQSYVRFFFFSADVNGGNQLELTTYYLLYDKVSVEKVETLLLNSGDITKYFLYDFASLAGDGQRKRGLVYDLKNLETGEILADHTDRNQSNAIGRGTDFKFGTAQIKNNGRSITVPIRDK